MVTSAKVPLGQPATHLMVVLSAKELGMDGQSITQVLVVFSLKVTGWVGQVDTHILVELSAKKFKGQYSMQTLLCPNMAGEEGHNKMHLLVVLSAK